MANFRAAIDKINADLAAQHAENDARVAREYEAEQVRKAEAQKTKTAESAKYLKEDLPTSKVGQPTWNYWDGSGRYANITGADGKEYMFVPDDYVKKGLVQEGTQFYNKQFLDPATFKNAVQYSLPKGMQSVINNNGYVWAADDYNKLGLGNSNGYKIDDNNPAILGLGTPHPSMQVGSPVSYITQPKLAPGGERVQQDWITSDGRTGGLGTYSYYKYQGPFADAARGALKELGPLTPILLDVFAGPGTGAIYSMSKAAGDASYTGDWNKAATTIGTIMAAPYVAGAVSGALGGVLDLGSVANSIVGNAAGNAVVAGLTGGDPVAAFVNGGVGSAVGTVMGKIDGFSQLPPSVQRVFNATLLAQLSGKDPTKAALLAATTSGLQAIKNSMDANAKFQSSYGRDATPEELNNFAYVQNQDELNQSFDQYMKTTAAQDSARQAEIDAQNRADAEAERLRYSEEQARLQAQRDDEAERLRYAEEQARLQAQRDDEVERLRQAGLVEEEERLRYAQEQARLQAEQDAEEERLRYAQEQARLQAQRDAEEEPPSTLPTEPILDDELEDPSESTDCPDGYLYNMETRSCESLSDPTLPKVPPIKLSKTPTTKTPTTKTPTTKTPTTKTPTTPTTTLKTPTTKTPTTKTPTTTPVDPNAPVDPSAATKQAGDMSSLLGILSALGGGSTAAPTPAPTVDIGAGADFDPFGELMTNPFAKQQTHSKMTQAAGGGSVDDLLALLNWKG